VGVIPEDWHLTRFADIADKRIPWSIAGGPFGSNLKAVDYRNEGVRIIQLQNIGDGFFNDNYAIYTSEEKANELLSCNIYPGEIILSKMGDPVARACFVPNSDKRYLMASDGIRLAVDKSRFDKRFVHCFINFVIFRRLAIEASTGSTRQRIGLEDLKQLYFVEPSLIEQQAIATALSDVDALIESLDRLIAKKRDIKQAAMQELLTGKRRLTGFSGEWETKKLGDLGNFIKGRGIAKNESLTGNLPCIRYGEIYTKHNDCIKEFFSWISQDVASTATRLYCGDILFAGSGETKEEIGKCVAFVSKMESYAGGDIVILRPKSVDSLFLGYYLNTTPINKQKASKGQGDAIVHISSTALADINITIPSVPEQIAISTILSDMDAELSTLEDKLKKSRMVKQGMMQELLTGQIRLVKPEIKA